MKCETNKETSVQQQMFSVSLNKLAYYFSEKYSKRITIKIKQTAMSNINSVFLQRYNLMQKQLDKTYYSCLEERSG